MDASVIAYAAGRSPNVTEIRVHRLHGRSDCLIDRRSENLHRPRNDNTVSGPALSGGYVYWALSGSLGTSCGSGACRCRGPIAASVTSSRARPTSRR
jgi:hypothetical protein